MRTINLTQGYVALVSDKDWHERDKTWEAKIRVNGELKHLGYFSNRKEAAKTYNRAAKKFFGRFASLNAIK